MDKGSPPEIDLDIEKNVQDACLDAIQQGIIKSAHDCSEGGLAVALAECCISNPDKTIGAEIEIGSNPPIPPFTKGGFSTFPPLTKGGGGGFIKGQGARNDALLFGETQSRIIVSLNEKDLNRFMEITNKYQAPANVIGKTGGDRLKINGLIDVSVETLNNTWKSAISDKLGAYQSNSVQNG